MIVNLVNYPCIAWIGVNIYRTDHPSRKKGDLDSKLNYWQIENESSRLIWKKRSKEVQKMVRRKELGGRMRFTCIPLRFGPERAFLLYRGRADRFIFEERKLARKNAVRNRRWPVYSLFSFFLASCKQGRKPEESLSTHFFTECHQSHRSSIQNFESLIHIPCRWGDR